MRVHVCCMVSVHTISFTQGLSQFNCERNLYWIAQYKEILLIKCLAFSISGIMVTLVM